MNCLLVAGLSCMLLLWSSPAASATYGMRISVVYAGGGDDATSNSTFDSDYVELYNARTGPIDLSGFALEFAAPGGNWGSTPSDIFVFPAGTMLQPCSYLLVVMSPAGPGAGAVLPTADLTGALAISAAGGAIGLFNQVNANTPCGGETGLRDQVGYGPGSCSAGGAIGALSPTTAAVRNNDGNMNTGDNPTDFMALAAPVPRNSASPSSPFCWNTPTTRPTWGELKTIYR